MKKKIFLIASIIVMLLLPNLILFAAENNITINVSKPDSFGVKITVKSGIEIDEIKIYKQVNEKTFKLIYKSYPKNKNEKICNISRNKFSTEKSTIIRVIVIDKNKNQKIENFEIPKLEEIKPSPSPTNTPKPSTSPTNTPKPSTTPTNTSKPSPTTTNTPKPSTTPKPNTDQNKVTKVLLVGNSYTYYNDYGGMLAELAKKTNHKIIVVAALHGGWGGTQLAKGKLQSFYWNATSSKTKAEKSKKGAYTLTEIAKKDWGNLNRGGKWDYVILQNNDSESNIKSGDIAVYNKVKKMIPNSKRFVILSTYYASGKSNSNRLKKHEKATKEINASIIHSSYITSKYSNWKDYLAIKDDSNHPSGRGAYLHALCVYAKIYGRNELATSNNSSKFIKLYNSSSNDYREFTKELYYKRKSAPKSAMSITKSEAKKLQALVYKYYNSRILYR